MDLGTHGWFLSGNATVSGIDVKSYNFFVFLNSSVRGPYLPSYLLKGPLVSSQINFANGDAPVPFCDLMLEHAGTGGPTAYIDPIR